MHWCSRTHPRAVRLGSVCSANEGVTSDRLGRMRTAELLARGDATTPAASAQQAGSLAGC